MPTAVISPSTIAASLSGAGSSFFAAVQPDLRVQVGSLDATGPLSYFAVVGGGSGSPVAYSTYSGQFSSLVSSAMMDADPFSDRLLDVAAGDLVTFVIAVQNVAPEALAWDLVLRDTPPAGFIVPVGGADINVSDGAGNPLDATGNLFSTTDGLHLYSGSPMAGYDSDSGLNVALVTFTLQATGAMPAFLATLRDTGAVVHVAASSGGANLAAGAPGLAGWTEMVTMAPAISIALTGTGSAATSGNQLAVGETATFHASVILPGGRSQALRLDAAVPAGLSLVSETITYATPGTTGLWVGETSGSGFGLGTISSGSPVRVEYDIVARATGAANGSVQAVVSASDPAGGGSRVSAAQGMPVVALAPVLSLQVNGPGQVQAGQAATYTVRLSNAAGAASAYGITLADVLGAGLTLVPGTVQGSGPAAGAVVSNGSGSSLAVTIARLDPGESLVLTLQAQGTGSVGAGLQSQARATAASLPGGNAAYQLATVLASGAAALVAPTAGLTLSGLSARVGDVVVLHVTAWLPAGDNPAVRIVVHLPAGLSFVPGSVQAAGSAAPVVTANANGVAVSLGRVTAPAGGGAVSVDLQAVVGAAPVGAGLGCSAVVETGYAASAADVAAVRVADTAPAIGGAVSGQATTTTQGSLPLAGLTLADPDVGQVETLRVLVTPGLGRLGGALGSYDPATGTYTAYGAVDALQADARGLVFTPAGAGDATLAVTLDDGAGGVARDAATTVHIQATADTAGVAQHFLQLPGATFLANAGGQQTMLVGEQYNGPVSYLQSQLIYDSAGPAVIVAHTDNTFIKSFSGFCAIQVAGGRNVVDAGPGSNFIVGGAGDDTFFLNGSQGAVTWDTITGFHPGDTVTLFGFHAGTSSFAWTDAEGAAGYTGRTIHADLAGDGGITSSLTFAGTTAADTDGYAVTTGTVGRVDYLAVTAVR